MTLTIERIEVLSEAGKKGGSRPKHQWTEEERAIIRRDYQGTLSSRAELAGRLGVTPFAVAGQVARLGMSKRDNRRAWTPEEDRYLLENMNKFSCYTVARHLGRSINAVVIRSKRLGISLRARDGWFTKNDVCEILGVDHKWIQRRIESGHLKATFHYMRRPSKIGGTCWHIKESDLKKYIRTYPQELTGRNVDIVMIVDILAGVI